MISNLSMPQIHELVDLIPSPCVVFDLAPFSWPGEGGSLLWGTPPHPPARTFSFTSYADRPCNPFLAFPDQTSSPVVDPHWCDITLIRSRYP